MMSVRAVSRPAVFAAAAWLAACAAPPVPPSTVPPAPVAGRAPAAAPPAHAGGAGVRYRCDQGLAFAVRFGDDAATIDAGPRGREVLLRDAGGETPRETVYSNERLRAEFGLGTSGAEAVLRYAEPPVVARCRQE